MALIVIGLSTIPPIIISLPASILFAIAISPSLESSSTFPISLKYILTGSSLRPASLSTFPWEVSSSFSSSLSELSPSSFSTLIPASCNIDITSSICSDETCPCGMAAFNSSNVTKPLSFPKDIIFFTSMFAESNNGLSPTLSELSFLFSFAFLAIITSQPIQNVSTILRHILLKTYSIIIVQ